MLMVSMRKKERKKKVPLYYSVALDLTCERDAYGIGNNDTETA